MAAPGIVLVKYFHYRGAIEEWTNRYHFVGDAPSDDAGWKSLADALIDLEKHVLTTRTAISRAYGYDNTDNDSVWSYDYDAHSEAVAGTLAVTGGGVAPGDSASWARWYTGRRNSNNRKIYLRKYFHNVMTVDADSDDDTLTSAVQDALNTFATDVLSSSGDWPGLAGPDGAAPSLPAVSTYATTRTLKRRGRRP